MAMTMLMILLLKAFVITYISICLLRSISFKLGLVDEPGGRKKHRTAVPLVGGLAIFLGYSLTLSAEIYGAAPYLVLWLASCVLLLISGMDDKYALRAGDRFFLHFGVIIAIAVFGETVIGQLGNLLGTGVIFLGWGSMVFTGIAAVGIINAVNMMDGIDGLTACVSLVELGILLFLSLQRHFLMETMIIVTFMGAIGAFLFFNFPVKSTEARKVFLGDMGSTLIGLVLVWLCIRLTQNAVHPYPPALMIWIVALPLMDMFHLMANRKARGLSPFRADRRHIHHMLLQLNYSPLQIIALLTTLSLLMGVMGVFLYQQGASDPLLFWGMFLVFFMYSTMVYLIKKRVSRRKFSQRHSPSLCDQNIYNKIV